MRKRLKIFDAGVLKAIVKWNDGKLEIKTDSNALQNMIEVLARDGVEDWLDENILFTTSTSSSEMFLGKLKRAGQKEKATEFQEKAMSSGSYEDVLALVYDYVDVE